MKAIIASDSVIPFHIHGGREKYIYYLTKHLTIEGIDVEVVTSLDKDKRRKVEIYENVNYIFVPPMIKWRTRGLIAPWYYLFYMQVARYLRKRKFDILHAYEKAAYAYLHFKNRVPTIVQPFGLEPFTSPSLTEQKGMRKISLDIASRGPSRYCITHADAIASEGDFQIEGIINLFGVDREKIFNLPIGIEISAIKEMLEAKTASRKDLGLADNDFVLISVNRLHPDKGINYLVDAFSILKQELNNAKLILIGTGREEERIKNQIKSYKLTDSIIHLKNVPEHLLYAYYGLSDVYVSPVLQDDWVMGIQEAMVCGLPVISTGQEFLVKDGVNGYIVSKRSPQAMANAILKMYDEGKSEMMGSKSEKMVEDYDWSVITKTAIKVYERLIEK